jgi:hypothetical protein
MWFDGLSDAPESIDVSSLRTSLISADRQLTVLPRSIKTASSIWMANAATE